MTHATCLVEKEIEAFARVLPDISGEVPARFELELHERLNHIDALSRAFPSHRPALMKLCFELCAEELEKGGVNRRIRQKPCGYAGDYLTLDWIYTRKVAASGVGGLWDQFALRQTAAEAVRNRKGYFSAVFASLCEGFQRGVSVLDVASGPCRDVAEALRGAGPWAAGAQFHCVDIDASSVPYARAVVQAATSNATIEWEVANVFKIKPSAQYDLVWAAGLFDYLNDRYAIALLKKMWGWTRDGGRMIVGNVHPRNPTRNYLEWCLEWFLIHRTEQEMLDLCRHAGIPERCVSFDQEPLGVWIFCAARKTDT